MMQCSICGTPVIAGSEVCRGCGATVSTGSDGSGTVAHDGMVHPSPSRPLTRLLEQDAPFDAALWAAAIGPKNTDYYLPRFEAQLTRGRRARWNWAGMFITLPWLLYRKMSGLALGYLIAPFVLGPIVAVFIQVVGRHAHGAVPVLLIQLLIIAFGVSWWVVPAMAANSAYFHHCRALIQRESIRAVSRDDLLQRVAKAGGTRNGLALFAGFASAVAFALGVASMVGGV